MIKDIFIDADVICNLEVDSEETIEFLEWLYYYNPDDLENCAHLVVSQKLLNDWFGREGTCSSTKKNSIAAIYEQLNQKEKRIVKIESAQLRKFEHMYFTKKIWNNLRCKRTDSNDHYHIIAIYLSNRKLVLTRDENLTYDLKNIKFKKQKFEITVGKNPSDIDYKNYEIDKININEATT